MSSPLPKFRFLSAWFCPYAHRATIALQHHSCRIEYEWVEALGWEQRVDESNVTEWWYHWKSDELVKANPSALVPTLVPIEANGETNIVKSVFESLIVVDFIDAVSEATGMDRLVSSNPYEAARSRLWAEKLNRDCCSPYYGVLVRNDESERMESFQTLLKGLKSFSKELRKTSGFLFLADNQLSNADIALIPWAYRYYVLEYYRGKNYAIPTNDPDLKPYHEWYNYVFNLSCVKRTLPDKERYLQHIAKYADSSARSKVANAVRRGAAAHEIDDEKDTY
jgi:glutathione S-transferase